MILIEDQVDFLRASRKEKMAVAILVGTMVNSLEEATEKLEELIPLFEKIAEQSRSQKYMKNKDRTERLDVDHEICVRVRDLAKELYPWIKQVRELSKKR